MVTYPAVVVGDDGSAGAARAVRFAAEDAARRGRPLRVVNIDPRSLPAKDLISLSQGAELLVLGRGDVQRFGSALDSVAIEVLAHAHCPVVSVPADDPVPAADAVNGKPGHPGVVVGVKDIAHAEVVLDAAFAEAELRGCGLEVVHAWRHPEPSEHGDILPSVYDPVLCAEAMMERLSDAVQRFADKYPTVGVTILAPRAAASDALAVAARHAALLVVGASRRGPVRTALLGSNGQDLMREVRCPVLFVRPRHAR